MNKISIETAISSASLALVALFHSVKGAQELAKEQNVPFTRHGAIYHVRSFLGEGAVQVLEQKWPVPVSSILDVWDKISKIAEPNEVSSSLSHDENTGVIKLRFETEVPKPLRYPEAYYVFLDGEAIQVTDIQLDSKDPCYVELRLGSAPMFCIDCTCEIGLNTDTNELVGLFLHTKASRDEAETLHKEIIAKM